MKNIDIKSVIIGVLFTSTIFLGVAATSPNYKWDENQNWQVRHIPWTKILLGPNPDDTKGWEPIGGDDDGMFYRMRIK